MIILDGTLFSFGVLVPAISIQVLGSEFRAISHEILFKDPFVRYFFGIFIGSLLIGLFASAQTDLQSFATGTTVAYRVDVYLTIAFSIAGILSIPAYFVEVLRHQNPAYIIGSVAQVTTEDYTKVLKNDPTIHTRLDDLSFLMTRLIETRDTHGLDASSKAPSKAYGRFITFAKKRTKVLDPKGVEFTTLNDQFEFLIQDLQNAANLTKEPRIRAPIQDSICDLWYQTYFATAKPDQEALQGFSLMLGDKLDLSRNWNILPVAA
ncbi:MAG: hypothetical protein ABSF83_00720 [Nitrososphaerales archaeon]